MNNNILKTSLLILSISLISCNEEMKSAPEVATLGVTEITATSAVCNGELSDYWDTLVMGTVYSTNPNLELYIPEYANDSIYHVAIYDPSLQGKSFSCEITDLAPNTKYYVRTYVKLGFVNRNNEPNDLIQYGERIEFTTLAE